MIEHNVVNERGYKGNILLKRTNQAIEWTPELVAEYVKCSEDPVYFIENYMKIINVNDGLVNFKLYDYQEKFVKTIHENRFTISKWPRQSGKSTSVIGYITHYVTFNQSVSCAILANKLIRYE